MPIPLPPSRPSPNRQPRLDPGQGFLRRAIDRALGRKSTPARPEPVEGPHPEDKSWQPGDRAECLDGDNWLAHTPFGWANCLGPTNGQVFFVTAVKINPHPHHGEAIYLKLRGLGGMWEAAAFRKLQPLADKAVAADSTFLKDLRERLNRQPTTQKEDA